MTGGNDEQLQGVHSALLLIRNVLDRRQEHVASALVTAAMDNLQSSVLIPRHVAFDAQYADQQRNP